MFGFNILQIGLMAISGIFALIGSYLSNTLRAKFQQYSQLSLANGMSGAEVASKMLQYYGIQDVRVTQVEGQLTDHYNPKDKTVNLSSDVYSGRNVSAAAVAAHECGHAVQHATAYAPLSMRSVIVPVVNIASGAMPWIVMLGAGGAALANNPIFVFIALAVFAVVVVFSLITLPVEFDASRRALVWLEESGVARGREHDGAKDALWWAAMTYVAAALAALAQFLFVLIMLLNNRKRD